MITVEVNDKQYTFERIEYTTRIKLKEIIPPTMEQMWDTNHYALEKEFPLEIRLSGLIGNREEIPTNAIVGNINSSYNFPFESNPNSFIVTHCFEFSGDIELIIRSLSYAHKTDDGVWIYDEKVLELEEERKSKYPLARTWGKSGYLVNPEDKEKEFQDE